jgi:hypothetical protein
MNTFFTSTYFPNSIHMYYLIHIWFDLISFRHAVKDSLQKCKHLFSVGSSPQHTLETAMRYIIQGNPGTSPLSSYWIDPLVLLHAKCIAMIHVRITSIPLGRWETLIVFLKNPKGVTQDQTWNLWSDSQWSNQLSHSTTLQWQMIPLPYTKTQIMNRYYFPQLWTIVTFQAISENDFGKYDQQLLLTLTEYNLQKLFDLKQWQSCFHAPFMNTSV